MGFGYLSRSFKKHGVRKMMDNRKLNYMDGDKINILCDDVPLTLKKETIDIDENGTTITLFFTTQVKEENSETIQAVPAK